QATKPTSPNAKKRSVTNGSARNNTPALPNSSFQQFQPANKSFRAATARERFLLRDRRSSLRHTRRWRSRSKERIVNLHIRLSPQLLRFLPGHLRTQRLLDIRLRFRQRLRLVLFHQDDVISERRLHRLADVTNLERKRRLLKRRHHHSAMKLS